MAKESLKDKEKNSEKKMAREPRKDNTFTAILKFVPLVAFIVMVVVFRLDLLAAAPIAAFLAACVYMFLRRANFTEAIKPGVKAARKIVMIFFILMFTYGLAECFMAAGVGAALIRICMAGGMTGRSVAPVALFVTALLSFSIGSSWGSFAASAPIFLWLSYIVGGDPVLTVCAVAGGACFGDNTSFISGNVALASELQGVSVQARVRNHMLWAILCLAISMVVFYFVGLGLGLSNVRGDLSTAMTKIPAEVVDNLAVTRPSAAKLLTQVRDGVPVYLVLPIFVVIVMSLFKMNTLLCLGAGMVSSLLLGTIAGTVGFNEWLNDLILKGYSDAGNWTVIMMLWIAAFGGIMDAMGVFDPLAKLAVKASKNSNMLMGWCGVLAFVGNMALADESAQAVTLSPVLRDIANDNLEITNPEDREKFGIRLSLLTTTMGVYGSEMVPWHCYPVFFASIATAVYPLMNFTPYDIISRNYMSFITVGSLLILTFTGLGILKGFRLPKNVSLKKKDKLPPKEESAR